MLEISNITLPTAYQIANTDFKTFSQSLLTLSSSWLLTTNYWTKTASNLDSNGVWRVGGGSFKINYSSASDSSVCCDRPVITTFKTNLLKI